MKVGNKEGKKKESTKLWIKEGGKVGKEERNEEKGWKQRKGANKERKQIK